MYSANQLCCDGCIRTSRASSEIEIMCAVSRRTEGRRTKVRRPRGNEDNAPLFQFQFLCSFGVELNSHLAVAGSMRPFTELRINRMFVFAGELSTLDHFQRFASGALALSQMVILVPAVMYRPASTVQLSPREMPIPAWRRAASARRWNCAACRHRTRCP